MMSQRRRACIRRISQAVPLAVSLIAYGCAVRQPVGVAMTVEPWTENGFAGRRITTDHFQIISTLDDAAFEAALPGFLEAAYQRYECTLPSPENVGAKLTVYVFRTRSEWERFTRCHYPGRYDVYSLIRSGGFTEGDTSVSFCETRSATLATLAHEGWHQYVGSRFSRPIPAWLNEGLACYHEAVDFTGPTPRFTPQHNTFRINSLREAVQTDRLLPLAELVNTDAGEVIRHDHSRLTQTYYAQAWALVTFLQHGARKRYAGGFQTLLSDITDGTFHTRVSAAQLGAYKSGGSSTGEAVFQTYFGCTPDELDGAYHDYLVRLCGF